MKKTLVALATLAAVSGAFAQTSSVTLFGVVDASVARISSSGRSVTGLASGDQTSSRLGFRGTEDLGNGLSAGFWLEGGVNVDTGTGGSGGFAFERRSTVSVLSRSLGELRLGRDKVPQYLNIEAFDPFGDIGVGGVGGSNLVGGTGFAVGTPEGSGPKRASNTVGYLLPGNLGGFYGQVQYAFGEQSSEVANDTLRNSAGLRFGYKAGPLDVAAAWGEVRGGTTAAGIDYRASNAGISYDFGVIKPMAQFAVERGNGRKVELFLIGATAPLGNGDLRVAFSNVKRKDIGNADAKKLAVGYGYNFSKRTQVYATVARVDNDSNVNRGLAVSSAALASPTIGLGRNVTGYELGLRHSF